MIKVSNILFLDIETVPQYSSYAAMPKLWRELWNKKASHLIDKDQTAEDIYPRAGIYAEFGKIICISVGYLVYKDDQRFFRTKSFAGDDEQKILHDFNNLLADNYNTEDHYLCAHNGKEFDFPYLGRRMLVNRIKPASILNLQGKKPWEVRHLDTMQLWKFGDFKSFTSLELLAATMGIPTPKDDIDGSMIYDVYYEEKDLNRIVKYCTKDVVTLASVYLRMKNEPELTSQEISIAN